MSAQNSNGTITLIAGEALAIYRRVKLNASGQAVYADEADSWVGVTQAPAASGAVAAVRLRYDAGTFLVTANGAITSGAEVFTAADGEIAPTGGAGLLVGQAMEAAAADGDQIEVLFTAQATTPDSGTVAAATLANAVADAILLAPSVTVANTGTPDGNATITIQARDAQGNSLAARCLVRVWFAATAYAAPADLGTLTATTGVILKEDTDDALATVATDANGTAVLVLDTASNGTVHAMASIVGLCGTASASITGN